MLKHTATQRGRCEVPLLRCAAMQFIIWSETLCRRIPSALTYPASYPVRRYGQNAFGVETLAQGRLVGIGQKDAAGVVGAQNFDNRQGERVGAKLGVQARRRAGVFFGVGQAVLDGQDIHLPAQTTNVGLDRASINRDSACHFVLFSNQRVVPADCSRECKESAQGETSAWHDDSAAASTASGRVG